MAVDSNAKAPETADKGKVRSAPEARTLIDDYACAALTGLLAAAPSHTVLSGPDTAATAFRYALAMKNERAKLTGQL